MKVWITKYALDKGILEFEEFDVSVDGKMVEIAKLGIHGRFYGEGKDWHLSLDSAQFRALAMIAAKRKSIAKTLKKLDKLEQELKGQDT